MKDTGPGHAQVSGEKVDLSAKNSGCCVPLYTQFSMDI